MGFIAKGFRRAMAAPVGMAADASEMLSRGFSSLRNGFTGKGFKSGINRYNKYGEIGKDKAATDLFNDNASKYWLNNSSNPNGFFNGGLTNRLRNIEYGIRGNGSTARGFKSQMYDSAAAGSVILGANAWDAYGANKYVRKVKDADGNIVEVRTNKYDPQAIFKPGIGGETFSNVVSSVMSPIKAVGSWGGYPLQLALPAGIQFMNNVQVASAQQGARTAAAAQEAMMKNFEEFYRTHDADQITQLLNDPQKMADVLIPKGSFTTVGADGEDTWLSRKIGAQSEDAVRETAVKKFRKNLDQGTINKIKWAKRFGRLPLVGDAINRRVVRTFNSGVGNVADNTVDGIAAKYNEWWSNLLGFTPQYSDVNAVARREALDPTGEIRKQMSQRQQ